MKIPATLMLLGVSAIAFAEAPNSDDSFLHEVAQGNMAEIETGQLAQNKGTSEAVKQFGAMMVEHHTAAHDKVEALAKRKNVPLPTAPSETQKESMKELQARDGARFDQQYIAEQVEAHEKTLELLKSEISAGRDPETKALAQEMLPTVQSHLRQAYKLAGEDEKAAQMPK